MKITVEGEVHEDIDLLKQFVHTSDLWSANWEARQLIRARLKYEEDISDEEEKFLEQLQEVLFICELEN